MEDPLAKHNRRVAELVRGAWMGFLLNVVFLGSLAMLKPHEPRTQIRLTTTESHVIVYGYGIFGNFVVRTFPTWNATLNYLEAQKIEFPVITYAHLPQAQGVLIKGHKITWGPGSQPRVLFAPDRLSSFQMAQYLTFVGLNSSPLGFSLNLNSN